ncbi:MAG TPA: DUF167 domain-containing protein [Pseudonocardiaceae bacterium]|jgi:hypothetical protein|nr:DUF167 domain-containing protein [Pseudonocardiaceae bacterium]
MTEHRFAVRVLCHKRGQGAAKQFVGGSHPGPHGPALIVAVTAPAVEGKANEALRKALASALDIRRADIEIVVGAHGRDKIIVIDAAPDRMTMIIDKVTQLRDK